MVNMLLLLEALCNISVSWCELLIISLRLSDSYSDHQKALVKLQNLHILINGSTDEVTVNPVFRSSIKLYQLVTMCSVLHCTHV